MQETKSYEFNDEQNRLINDLGAKMVTVGGIQMLLGLLLLALAAMLLLAWHNGHLVGPAALPGWLPGVVVGVFALLPLMIGGWVRSAGGSFESLWLQVNAPRSKPAPPRESPARGGPGS